MRVRMRVRSALLGALLCMLAVLHVSAAGDTSSPGAGASTHTNNWAVIVSTSRYWFNYRHTANALAVYHTVRGLGIPDSNIILMLPDEYACNPRNVEAPAVRVGSPDRGGVGGENLHTPGIEVDYRGSEVTVPNFMRLLTGRHGSGGAGNAPATPRSKRLLSDADSNVLIYLTGHGGDNFLKFQDHEELNAQDVRDALQQMHVQRRYRSVLVVLDTCQAATLFRELNEVDTPNVVTIGSSVLGQSSYSYLTDKHLGVSLADRFTYFTLEWFERNGMGARASRMAREREREREKASGRDQGKEKGGRKGREKGKTREAESGLSSKKTLLDLFSMYNFSMLHSEVEVRADLLPRSSSTSTPLPLSLPPGTPASVPLAWAPLASLPLTDYFGAVTHVQPTQGAYEIGEARGEEEEREKDDEQEEELAGSAPYVDAASPTPAPSTLPSTPPLPVFTPASPFWMLLAGGVTTLLLASLTLDGNAGVAAHAASANA